MACRRAQRELELELEAGSWKLELELELELENVPLAPYVPRCHTRRAERRAVLADPQSRPCFPPTRLVPARAEWVKIISAGERSWDPVSAHDI